MKLSPSVLYALLFLALGGFSAGEVLLDQSKPAPELTPQAGTRNLSPAINEAADAPFADLPTEPPREVLEALQMEGLLLCALPARLKTDGTQEKALATALKSFVTRVKPEDGAALAAYIAQFPEGAWTAGLRVTHGRLLYTQGRFSEALAEFERAWGELKEGESAELKKAALSAAAELTGVI